MPDPTEKVAKWREFFADFEYRSSLDGRMRRMYTHHHEAIGEFLEAHAAALLALIGDGEVVGWESRCPNCGNRVGSLGPDRPQQRICGCAFKSPLIFRPLTYGGKTMAEYRKLPVVIEAMEFTDVGLNGSEIRRWSNDAVIPSPVLEPREGNPTGSYLQIKTLEGTMTAIVGAFIIRGVQGEFYPCKPDIFWATYEPVNLQRPTPEPDPTGYVNDSTVQKLETGRGGTIHPRRHADQRPVYLSPTGESEPVAWILQSRTPVDHEGQEPDEWREEEITSDRVWRDRWVADLTDDELRAVPLFSHPPTVEPQRESGEGWEGALSDIIEIGEVTGYVGEYHVDGGDVSMLWEVVDLMRVRLTSTPTEPTESQPEPDAWRVVHKDPGWEHPYPNEHGSNEDAETEADDLYQAEMNEWVPHEMPEPEREDYQVVPVWIGSPLRAVTSQDREPSEREGGGRLDLERALGRIIDEYGRQTTNELDRQVLLEALGCSGLLSPPPESQGEAGWTFECPECGFDSAEAKEEPLAGDQNRPRYCGICAGDCGKDVALIWTQVSAPESQDRERRAMERFFRETRGATPQEVVKHLEDAAWWKRMDGGCHSRCSEVLTVWAKHLRVILFADEEDKGDE